MVDYISIKRDDRIAEPPRGATGYTITGTRRTGAEFCIIFLILSHEPYPETCVFMSGSFHL